MSGSPNTLLSTVFAVVAPALVLAGLMSAVAAGEGGPRLATDPAVRAGMDAIRAAVVDHHTLITHRRLPVATAQSFARRVEAAVDAIASHTGVAPEARARLDPLLATIAENARTIGAGGDSLRQMDALFAIAKALDDYGAHFDHPGWTPLQARP